MLAEKSRESDTLSVNWSEKLLLQLMNIMKPKNLALGFLSLLSLASFATAAEHPEKPFLWEISGNGLSEPSYLFGTIHLGDPRVTTMHPAAKKAFDAADSVKTEIPLDFQSQMALAPMMMRKDGKTLDESIGKDLAKALNVELALINPQLNSAAFQPLSTWAMSFMLPLLEDQMKGNVSLDQLIWDQATAAGKKTGGIEKPMDQLGIFMDLSEAEQVIFLFETLKGMSEARAEGIDPMQDLLEAYISGDRAKVQEQIEIGTKTMKESEHKELGERMLKRLFTDRDITMAESIAATLKAEPDLVHFFAAGTGHFTPEISIRSHLVKMGYEIRRIEK